MRGLRDKVALVTGAGSGIGRGIALRLAEEGARVAVADINAEGAGHVAAEIATQGGQALALVVDVTDSAQVRRAVEDLAATVGPADVLVNNAGWDKVERFVDSSEETWDRVLTLNLKGQIICARAVLDPMIARGGGRIVNISSDAGRVGSTGEVVYSAAKGGVIAFTKALAREMARYGITVNCVCPGPADTPLLRSLATDHPRLVESLQRAIPFRRLAKPEDVAGAVAFLASDDAAYITGQTLSVSGGLTMA